MSFVRKHAMDALVLLVGVAIALIVYVSLHTDDTTVRNCHLVQTLSHVESEFIRTDAIDRKGALTEQERSTDIRAFQKIIGGVAKQAREQQVLDNRTINYWRNVLIPEAKGLVSAAKCPSK